MLAIARLMVIMNHHIWAILLVIVVGIGAFVLGSYIENSVARNIVSGIAAVTLGFVMAAGLAVGPLDDWEHQHGRCLLDTIEQMRKR
jgi:hypothetical protein